MLRSSWYKYALRKHMMRFDPRVVINAEPADTSLPSVISSLISACIIKGLDIVGFVSPYAEIAQQVLNIAKEQNVDLYILTGLIYKTADGFNVIVYNIAQPLPQNLTLEQVLTECQKNNYLSLVYDLGKKTSNMLYKMGEENQLKPTFVEIFSAKTYGYQYIKTNTYEVVSSGAESANELEESNIYTHVPRKDMESFGVIPQGQGVDYVPNYLQQVTQ
jgi:methyltransferase-like protein